MTNGKSERRKHPRSRRGFRQPAAPADGLINHVDNISCSGVLCRTHRPVAVMTKMEIDRSLYVDYEGKRVYFCCAGCLPAFEADPEKYMEVLHEIHEDPDAREEQEHDHNH